MIVVLPYIKEKQKGEKELKMVYISVIILEERGLKILYKGRYIKNAISVKVYLSRKEIELLIKSIEYYKWLVNDLKNLFKLNNEEYDLLKYDIDFLGQELYSIYCENFSKNVLTQNLKSDIRKVS